MRNEPGRMEMNKSLLVLGQGPTKTHEFIIGRALKSTGLEKQQWEGTRTGVGWHAQGRVAEGQNLRRQ